MDTQKVIDAIDRLADAGRPDARSAIELWKATGQGRFRDYVLNQSETVLAAAIFAFRETGEERYLRAMETLESRLDDSLAAQPLKMELGILRGATDQYYRILGCFQEARREMEAGRPGLSETVTYIAALADTLEVMNRKVYECSRPLQDSLKDTLRGLLKGADPVTGLLGDTWASAMTAAVIFKACRMRLILAEKYVPAGEKILDTLLREPVTQSNAALLMACAEYLKLKKWEVGIRWKS